MLLRFLRLKFGMWCSNIFKMSSKRDMCTSYTDSQNGLGRITVSGSKTGSFLDEQKG